jgi:hypothetical protein
MAFFVRYKDRVNGALVDVETSLSPAPTEVEYPDGRAQTVHVTQDGAVVVQRPLRDARVRRWLWKGYAPTHAPYAALWTLLKGLDHRTRLEAGLPGTVEVWEDMSGVGGFGEMDGANKRWTTVRVANVFRVPRSGGGPVRYDLSTVEFYVEDPAFGAF